MTTRKRKDSSVRKIMRLGGSYVISLPIEYIEQLDWKEKQKVVVELQGKKLTVKDWKPKR